MKINVINILKIAIIVLVVLWIGLLTFDYFKAQNNQKPLICLSEKNINNSLLICIFSTTDRLFNPLTSKITVHIIYLYIDSHI